VIATAVDGTTTALSAHNPENTLSATLQAFERYGVSRILAEPAVSAVSGESAKLTVGGEVPIPRRRPAPPPRVLGRSVARVAPSSRIMA
jgi:Flp pilus assembly secretin CpaC